MTGEPGTEYGPPGPPPERRCAKARPGPDRVEHEPHEWAAGVYLPVGDTGYTAACPGWSPCSPEEAAEVAAYALRRARIEVVVGVLRKPATQSGLGRRARAIVDALDAHERQLARETERPT